MLDNDTLWQAIRSLSDNIALETDPTHLQLVAIDDQIPRMIVYPETAEEASAILQYADSHNLKVAIRGGGTRSQLGNPLERLDLVLSTARLNKIIEYSQPDLTIGVQGGVRLDELQAELEKHGQFLPVESQALDRGATVGGAIATASSGPFRLAYGPARDWVIGVKFVLADGTMAKGGGRVVKNVAGFDMMKLFTGSLGTLGLIHEMNFKLLPLPAAFATLVVRFASLETACQVALQTIDTGTFPSALTVLDRAGATALNLPESEAVLLIEVRNTLQAVERQVRDITVLCHAAGSTEPELIDDQTIQQDLWRKVTDFGYRELPSQSVILKVSTLPDGTASLLTLAQRLAVQYNLALQSAAHAGHGLTWLTVQYEDETAMLQFIRELSSTIEGSHGSVAVESIPVVLKRQLADVWGSALSAGELKLMRGVKEKLDPNRTLNPGRFVGKI